MSYILFSGGLIIWPIILLSIISLAIIIEKSWNLARDMVLPRDLTKDVISQIEKKSLTILKTMETNEPIFVVILLRSRIPITTALKFWLPKIVR